MIVRNRSQVSFRNNSDESPSNNQEETILFKLKRNGENYEIHPMNTNQPNDRLWMVIRNYKEIGYKINKYDIIKLGRMKFRVKEYRNDHEYFNELDGETPHQGFDEMKNIADTETLCKEEEEEINPACRFCWVSDNSEDNPIFRSCN